MGSAQKISQNTFFNISNRVTIVILNIEDEVPLTEDWLELFADVSMVFRLVVQNDFVVLYNPWLLRQLKCHLNVEICSSIKAIKYVLKYINEGAIYNLQKACGQHVDEIKNYLEGRYVGCVEAFMRFISMCKQQGIY